MKYFIDKNKEVFAYSDEQLSQVKRISDLETEIKTLEPSFVEAENNLQIARQELDKAKAQLDIATANSSADNEDKANENLIDIEKKTQIFNDKNKEFEELKEEFERIESEYRPLSDEYDAILPVFFDIRERLKLLKKMTDEDIYAYLNPPISKEQYVTESEERKQSLLSEATDAIAPLQDAVDLDMATDGELASLKEWKKYRVLLNRVDTSQAPDIEWPQKPTK